MCVNNNVLHAARELFERFRVYSKVKVRILMNSGEQLMKKKTRKPKRK